MRADNLIRGGVHDELHERLLNPAREGYLHRGERARVDVAGHALRHGLLLGHAHGGHGGLAENRGWDVFVVGLGGLAQHHGVLERHALHQRHGGEVNPVGHVAHGVDRRHGCLGVLVHDDGALGVELDANLLQAEVRAVGVWDAAGGPHHAVRLDLRPVVQREGEGSVVVLGDGHRVGARVNTRAPRREVSRHRLANLLVETPQGKVRAVHDVHLRSEALEDTRELHGDVPAADDDDALGLVLKRECLVGGDAELGSGNVGLPRPAPGREQDGLGGDRLLVAVDVGDLHAVGAGDATGALVLLHAGAVEQSAVDAVESLNLAVLGCDEPLPGELGHLVAVIPAEADGIAELGLERGAVHEELLRDAAADHAGAAEAAGGGGGDGGVGKLDEADLGARLGGHARRANAAGATTCGMTGNDWGADGEFGSGSVDEGDGTGRSVALIPEICRGDVDARAGPNASPGASRRDRGARCGTKDKP